MHINQAVETFCNYLKAGGRSERTIEVYRQRLKILLPLGEIEGIRSEDIDCLIADFWDGHAKATMAGYIQAVKCFFSWALKRKYLTETPAGGLTKPHLSYRAESKAINQLDLEQMIELAHLRNRYLDYAVLLVLADTGCRVGELVNLNISNVHLDKLEAIARGKTGERYLDFTQLTGDAILAWLAVRPETDPNALFTTHAGRVSIKRVYVGLQQLAGELEIKRFNPHSIRHRVGQGWIDQGANLEVIRQKLGHKNIATTAMIYGNQDRQRIKRASKRFSLVKNI